MPPTGGARFDWTMAALSGLLVAGFYLDLWAHAHGRTPFQVRVDQPRTQEPGPPEARPLEVARARSAPWR